MSYKEEFEVANGRFLWILAQFKEVEAINIEINKITKGKKYRIYNQAVFNLYINQYKYLFVILYQFCKYMVSAEGPLVKAKNFCGDFIFNYLNDLELQNLSHIENIVYNNKKSIVHKHFTCTSCPNKLCTHDFDYLMDQFKSIAKPIKDKRDKLSHLYEPWTTKNGIQSLDLKDVKEVLGKINYFIGILTWFTETEIRWSSDVTLYTDESGIAKDIVDQILCGTISQIPFDLKYNVDEDYKIHMQRIGDRIKFYSRLHEIHNSLPPEDQEKINFNDKTSDNSCGIFFSEKLLKFKEKEVDWNEFDDKLPYRIVKSK